jgi:hypothetical protein
MKLNKDIKALKAKQQRIARQQAALEAKFNAQLAALPAQFDFKSAADFIAAFKAATGAGWCLGEAGEQGQAGPSCGREEPPQAHEDHRRDSRAGG